jgi:hypothetical protein
MPRSAIGHEGEKIMEKTQEQELEKEAVTKTLRLAVETFRSCNSEYRILGSTLIAAHVGRVFRHIGDLDVLLDERSRDCVFEKLRNEGFTIQEKRKTGFRWTEAVKEGHLGLTFLLVGAFAEDGFSWRFSKACELRIKSDYLTPTQYNFDNVHFIGIPMSSVLSGIHQSFLNPKRKIDKKVLEGEVSKEGVRTYGNIHIYVFGIKIPFLYDLFSFVYNMYGGIRVLFGKRYEMWD